MSFIGKFRNQGGKGRRRGAERGVGNGGLPRGVEGRPLFGVGTKACNLTGMG